jgi:predicted NAD/FAD-dependent oxidoreductase
MRSNTSSATHCVAIIGAGIAGSAAAYFAHAAFFSDLSVVVFEQSAQIGGRIQHRPFADTIVETGATLMHSSNEYLSEFIDELGLNQVLPHDRTGESSATVGISNHLSSGGRFVWGGGFITLTRWSRLPQQWRPRQSRHGTSLAF